MCCSDLNELSDSANPKLLNFSNGKRRTGVAQLWQLMQHPSALRFDGQQMWC